MLALRAAIPVSGIKNVLRLVHAPKGTVKLSHIAFYTRKREARVSYCSPMDGAPPPEASRLATLLRACKNSEEQWNRTHAVGDDEVRCYQLAESRGLQDGWHIILSRRPTRSDPCEVKQPIVIPPNLESEVSLLGHPRRTNVRVQVGGEAYRLVKSK